MTVVFTALHDRAATSYTVIGRVKMAIPLALLAAIAESVPTVGPADSPAHRKPSSPAPPRAATARRSVLLGLGLHPALGLCHPPT